MFLFKAVSYGSLLFSLLWLAGWNEDQHFGIFLFSVISLDREVRRSKIGSVFKTVQLRKLFSFPIRMCHLICIWFKADLIKPFTVYKKVKLFSVILLLALFLNSMWCIVLNVYWTRILNETPTPNKIRIILLNIYLRFNP